MTEGRRAVHLWYPALLCVAALACARDEATPSSTPAPDTGADVASSDVSHDLPNDDVEAEPDTCSGVVEVCGNRTDDNCDGSIICDGGTTDDDGDEYASVASGGTDCNDEDPNVHPDASAGCPCPAGQWWPRGATHCTTTDPGYYSPQDDGGQYPSGMGMVAPAGSAAPMPSPSGGFYAPDEANAEPVVCGPGNATDAAGGVGATSCMPCPVGAACPGDGSFALCAEDTYQPSVGQEACLPCPDDAETDGPGARAVSDCFVMFGNDEAERECDCSDNAEQVCLRSRNDTFVIDRDSNLERLCFELTGGAYRDHNFSTGNSRCADWNGEGWVERQSGNFDEVIGVSCYVSEE